MGTFFCPATNRHTIGQPLFTVRVLPIGSIAVMVPWTRTRPAVDRFDEPPAGLYDIDPSCPGMDGASDVRVRARLYGFVHQQVELIFSLGQAQHKYARRPG